MKWRILTKGLQRIGLCVCISFIVNFPGSIFAQDLGVENVSVSPLQGKSGDNVTLTAEIKNYSGMAFSIQYGWYLSSDADIDPAEDMALGDIITDYRYLYENRSLTVSTSVTLPAFFDAEPPSYIGLIIDPDNLYDENPDNNIGSTMFTYTGTPPGTISDPRGDNYLDAVCVATGITDGNLNIDITFAAPPGSMVSLIMGMDLDQNPYTTGTNTTLPGTEAMVSLVFEKLTQSSVVSLQTNAGTYSLANAVLSTTRSPSPSRYRLWETMTQWIFSGHWIILYRQPQILTEFRISGFLRLIPGRSSYGSRVIQRFTFRSQIPLPAREDEFRYYSHGS